MAIEPNLEISRKEEQKLAEVVDPKTDCEYAWHIGKVNADVTRKQFSVTGENVRVAHLDTGYTEHPELVIGSAVMPELGYDFYDNKKDSMAPLNTIPKEGGLEKMGARDCDGKRPRGTSWQTTSRERSCLCGRCRTRCGVSTDSGG